VEKKTDFICAVCGQYIFCDFYLVRNETWKAAGLGTNDYCHIDCLSKKLGRDLTMADFDPSVPLNRLLVFGYLMGRRANPAEELPTLPPEPV